MNSSSSNKDERLKMLTISSEHSLRNQNLPFDIDVWYPTVASHTFNSKFLSLRRCEAEAIVNFYQTFYNCRRRLTLTNICVLIELEKRLDTSIRKHFPGGAFLRLAGRSPKDAEPLSRAQLRKSYQEALSNVLKEDGTTTKSPTPNQKLRAIGRTQYLKAEDGVSALNCLLSSERVFTDLHDYLRYGEPEQICLREWCDEMKLEYEFRCFVYENELRAISQYDHYCVYAHLTPMKADIEKAIRAALARVHPMIGERSYIIDFLYIPERQEARMIELSPFRECTGPACFKWHSDGDQLRQGPFEFRLNDHTHPQLEDIIESNWEYRWRGEVKPYWNVFKGYVYAAYDRRQTDKKWMLVYGAIAIVVMLMAYSGYYTMAILLGLCVMILVVRDHLLRVKIRRFLSAPHERMWSVQESQKLLTLIDKEERSKAWKGHENEHYLFVYGTLKTGFHWNKKHLSFGERVGDAKTQEKYHLKIGASGVPYLLSGKQNNNNNGKQISGELWKVSSILLQDMDEYEGVHKGYYKREEITVQTDHGKVQKAFVYVRCESSPTLEALESHSAYTLEHHQKFYQPIKHIQVKQLAYLSEQYHCDH